MVLVPKFARFARVRTPPKVYHHQNNRYSGGGDLASVEQLV